MSSGRTKKVSSVTNLVNRRIVSAYSLAAASVFGAGVADPAHAQLSKASVSEIKLETGVEHNSNVSRSDAARAAARGLEQSDQRVTPALSVDLARSLGRTGVSVSGSAGYDFYARNTQLNRERVDLELAIGQPIGPCKLDLLTNVARRQSDLGDIAFASNAVSGVVINAETRLQYGTDVSCGQEYGFRPTAHIDYLTARNSNTIRDRAEFNQLDYRLGIEYSTPRLGQFLAYLGRREITLLNQPATGSGDIGYNITTFGIQYRRNIGSRLNAEVSIGQSKVAGGGAFVPKASGITWDVSLTAQLGSRLQITASTGQQFTNSLSSDASFLRSQPNRIEFVYAVNERMRLQAGYSNNSSRFSYSTIPSGIFIERDRRQLANAGLTYAFGRRWQLGLMAGYERRDANGTFFDYDGSFARATASLTL